jgi:hypothetical protein
MQTRRLAVWLFAVTMLVAGAWAQDYDGGPNGEAAPASSGSQPDVARISLIHGDASMQRGDTGDWATTSINAPLVRGDQVATGEKSRTEIQLDYANIIRLAAHSQVKIADLTRTHIQVQVAQGYVNYTMLKGGEADVEIDSPNVAVRPLKHGRYRVQVNSDSDSETDVIVRDGEAEITTPEGSTRVKSGEMITIRGTDQPEYKISSAPGNDDWDRWNKDRDNVIKDALSWGRTNRYYTGVNDLDVYGRWVYVPGYGNVWQPYQQAAWAPYQTGRWVWEPYYGWTWVSYEPWGWAPYHYGRWFYYRDSWCWWPGPVYVRYRPVWSPAFVFFVGFGHRSGFGFGSIGWFPVGPHDPYYPWYGRGFNRVNVVNVTNITNITNITNVNNVNVIRPLAVRGRQPYYSNANLALTNPRVRGSITSVSSENFGRGGNQGWRHGVDEHEWRDARVMTAQVPIVPTRDSLHAGSGNAAVPAGIQTRNNERFFTRHQPPAGPESFHDQMQRVQRVVGPEAAGASSGAQGNAGASGGVNVRTGNAGPTNGGVNARTGNAEIPRTGAATSSGVNVTTGVNATQNPGAGQQPRGGNDPAHDGFRRFPGSSSQDNHPGGAPTARDSPGRTTPGANEGMAQNNTPASGGGSKANTSGGNSAQDNQRDPNRDRGGWTRFGTPGGRSSGNETSGQSPVPRSTDQGRVSRTDNSGEPRQGSNGPNWQKFPSAGSQQTNDRQTNDRQVNGRQTNDRSSGANPGNPSPERGATQTPRTQEDRGGWQRFPSNSDRGPTPSASPADRSDRIDRGSPGGSKPPLELHRPIVTPRNEDHSSPAPSRTPDVHNEPRYTPPSAQRSEPRYSPPPQRSEPRYSPPSRSESRGESRSSSSGSSSRGSSGGSSSHGGGGHESRSSDSNHR